MKRASDRADLTELVRLCVAANLTRRETAMAAILYKVNGMASARGFVVGLARHNARARG